MPLPCGCRADAMCPHNDPHNRAAIANVPSPTPSVGRIVHYHPASGLGDHRSGEPVAGLITAVNSDETVDLTLFWPGFGHGDARQLVEFSDDGQFGCWTWPPRV